MSTRTDTILSRKIGWDPAQAKATMGTCVDRAADVSRENAKRSTSGVIPIIFSSFLTILYFPVTIVKTVSDYLSGKVTPMADRSVDASVKYSADVAKRSINGTIDASANSSNWLWSWFK